MRIPPLNSLHRYVGILIAPFLVIQTLSGLFLDFGLFRRNAGTGGAGAPTSLDALLVKLHFGPGLASDTYHLLLGAGIVWMAVSGWALYLKIRRARKKLAATSPSIVPPRDQSGTK